MSNNTMDEDEIVARAAGLQRQVDALHEEQDKLLEPLAQAMLSEINGWPEVPSREQLNAMNKRIERLPRGFHRSELRTLILRKTGE